MFIPNRPRKPLPPVQPDQRVKDHTGMLYLTGSTHETTGTLRRETPKVRGKRARRADKQRRRIARERVT